MPVPGEGYGQAAQINAAQQALLEAMAHTFMRKLFTIFPQLAQATVAPHTVHREHGPEMVSMPQLMAEIADNMNDLNANLETMIDVQVSLAQTALPNREADALRKMVRQRRTAIRRHRRGI